MSFLYIFTPGLCPNAHKNIDNYKLGRQITFDRSYIGRVESGEMMPSLLLMYMFSKECNITIDCIISML
ncbi:MAG: helix-turn-helix transcriptional regulator [bacterium]|nr:helix-turn-helix transcriptional regulator [bacterium]